MVDIQALKARAIQRMCRLHGLTEREGEVLEAVLNGQSRDAFIAERGIAKATFKWHMHNVLKKTRTTDRYALTQLFLRRIGL